MKRVLSFILAIVMLMTVAPLGFTVPAEIPLENELPMEELQSINEVEREILSLKEDTEESLSLFAAYNTISGVVNLPSGVRANSGDKVKIFVYKANLFEGDVLIKEYDSSETSKVVSFTEGASSVNWSVSVPDGSYNIAARLYTGNKAVSGEMVYFSENGTTLNSYLADKITVSGGSTAQNTDITLNSSSKYIKGTIDLTNVIPSEDTYINISAQNESNSFYSYNYSYIFAPKGATSVPFEIGVTGENVCLRVGSDYFPQQYYSDGTLKEKYNDRVTLDIKESIDELNIEVPALVENTAIKVTINYPDLAQERKRYVVLAVSEPDEYGNYQTYDDIWVYRESGSSAILADITFEECDGPVYLTWRDITGSNNIYLSDDESTLYYSEEYGVVGSVSMATDIRGLEEINVEFPQCYLISGNIDTHNFIMPSSKYLYVGAEFENEVFCERILASDGTFEINIPKRLYNENFKIFTAQDSLATCDSSTKLYGYEGTLTGNISNISADAGTYREITGTVSIDEPAGVNGVSIDLGYHMNNADYLLGKLAIKPGSTSASFTLPVLNNLSYEAYLYAEATLYEKENIALYSVDTDFLTKNEFDIHLGESVTYSGLIKTPDDSPLTESMTFQITIQEENGMWVYSKASIEKGKSSTNYSITVPKDAYIKRFSISASKTNDNYIKEIYYTSSGFADRYSEANVTASQNLELNIPLIPAKTFSGIIKAPEKLVHTGGEITYYVYAVNANTNVTYNSEYYRVNDFANGVPFKVAVPDNGASYLVYVNVTNTGESNLMRYSNYYYISNNSMTTSQNEATRLLPTDGLELSLPLAKSISGTISFEEGSVITSYDYEEGIEVYITLASTTGGRNYTKSLYIKNTDPIPFSIQVGGNDSYRMRVRLYNNEDVFTNAMVDKNLYLTASGASINESDAVSIASDDTTVNFIIPKHKSITGKVNVASDYQCITRPKEGWVYLTKSGESSNKSYKTYFDENLNYVALLDDTVVGDYTAKLAFSDMATNIIDISYPYSDEAISIAECDILNIDYTVQTGYAVSGVVTLPSDAYIEGLTYGAYLYIHSGSGTTYSNNISGISADNSEIPFMFGVPKTGYNGAYLSLYVNSTSGQGTSNIYKENTYYVDNTHSTSKDANKTTMNITGDVDGIRFNLLTGITYTFNISKPEGNFTQISGNVYIVDENGSSLKNNSFYFYQNSEEFQKVQFVFSKEDVGKVISYYYIAKPNDTNFDDIYKGKVYIAPDGSLSAFKEDIVKDTISTDKTFDIDLVKTEDVDFPDYIFESSHPYPQNKSSYTYRHPDTSVNAIKLTFSEDTILATGDKIKISGMNNYFYGDSLAGKTITVSGNYVTVTIEATSYSQGEFGFGVTSIEGIKYILTSAHPYICNYQENVYEYTYPEEVESLDVTFAPECELRSGDYLYVYDKDGNEVTRYAASSKYDEVVTVSGNYIKVVLDSNSSASNNDKFGFAITEIKPTPIYTVQYVNYDGTVLKEENVLRGEDSYSPSNPERPTENGIAYDFVGWDKEAYDVQSDMVINAVYESESCIMESAHPRPSNTNLIYGPYEFEGEGDSIFVTFSSKTELYGNSSSSTNYRDYITIYIYTTEDSPGEYYKSYYGTELAGKTIELPTKKFKVTLTTKSTSLRPFGFRITSVTEAIYHNVTFLDHEGNFLGTQQVPTQTKAVFNGEIPQRPAYGKTMYEFDGWDQDVSSVTQDMTVRAVYKEITGYFESKHKYDNNTDITYSYIHDNPAAQELYVTFSSDTRFDYYGYDNLTIYDMYGAKVGKYTYNSLSGKTITIPGSSFTMHFVSDSSGTYYGFKITNIEGKVPQYYTVDYVDHNGNIIYSQTVLEGTSSWFEGMYPQKPMENGVFYYFSSWDKDTSYVTGNMTVYPIFQEDRFTPIYTEDDLAKISNDLSGRYVLMNDITLTKPWTPLGSGNTPFTGELRGEMHIIRNIKISSSVLNENGIDCAGFFASTKNAMIREIGFEIDYDLPAQNGTLYLGGVCAFSDETMFEKCYVSGTIDINRLGVCVGGFICEVKRGSIMHCYSNVNITTNAGGGISGFVYEIYGGHIMESYSNSSFNAPNCNKAGFICLANSYTDEFGNSMTPHVNYGMFNSEKSGITQTNYHENYCGTVLPKTSAELKNPETYRMWDEAVGQYMNIWLFDENFWKLDDDINDGFPHLGFQKPHIKLEEAKASKKVVGGKTVVSVSFELSEELKEDAKVIYAAYKNNTFVGTIPVPVSAGYNGGEMDLSIDADYIKIFVWKDLSNMAPLTKSGQTSVE